MTVIQREHYLEKLQRARWNGRVKIITGIRRCGKSFLLSNIYKRHLLSEGIDGDQIIEVALDRKQDESLRNPDKLYAYILDRVDEHREFYVFVDEIQLSYKVMKPGVDISSIAPEDRHLAYTTFYDVLADLAARANIDIYVTGSNSKLLSKDVATTFRDRGTEIEMSPLSFREFHDFKQGSSAEDWEEYLIYGGMPVAVLEDDLREKQAYLSSLFEKVYRADIIERYHMQDGTLLDSLVDVLCSSIGCLTNPTNLANTLNSKSNMKTTDVTVRRYLGALEDSFLFEKAQRWDVKGKRYLDYPMKYYASDLGLRNARLGFRQIEPTHLMENAIYNELRFRGWSIDVGTIRFSNTADGKRSDAHHEIDFVVNRGAEKLYIQSALNIDDPEKHRREIEPLLRSRDFFRKIVVTGGSALPHNDENGITYIGIIPFLLGQGGL